MWFALSGSHQRRKNGSHALTESGTVNVSEPGTTTHSTHGKRAIAMTAQQVHEDLQDTEADLEAALEAEASAAAFWYAAWMKEVATQRTVLGLAEWRQQGKTEDKEAVQAAFDEFLSDYPTGTYLTFTSAESAPRATAHVA